MNDLFRIDPNSTGSKGLVLIGQRALVYRRDHNTSNFPGYVDLPGGGSEDGETPFETFKREVGEEFGLAIAPEQVVYSRRYPSIRRPGKYGHFPVVKLPAKEFENIVFGDEGLEYKLLSMDEILNTEDFAWPKMKTRIQDYLAWTEETQN